MRVRLSRVAGIATALLALATTRADAAATLAATTQANLGFGQVVATTNAGSVTVSPAGARSSSGGVIPGNSLGVGAASFAVTGEPNASYSIILPTTATLSAGAASMTVDGFTSSPSGAGNLGPAGAQAVTVGATLHVAAGQLPGPYSGSYDITLAYD